MVLDNIENEVLQLEVEQMRSEHDLYFCLNYKKYFCGLQETFYEFFLIFRIIVFEFQRKIVQRI